MSTVVNRFFNFRILCKLQISSAEENFNKIDKKSMLTELDNLTCKLKEGIKLL